MSNSFEAWLQGSGTIADRSHPELVRLDAVAGTTTYPGWEEDFKEAEEAHFSGSSLGPNFDRCLHILTEKQRMHLGDSSHPRLVQLDALSLTYLGWENDVKEAEMDHVKNYQSPFVRCLKSMQNKQAAFLGDRSHPELVRLDAVAGTTTYPGWEEDFKEAEEAHFSGSSLGPNFDRCLHILTEKQRMHLGDRSHPRLVQLDALSLTYLGWENDVKEAEMDHVKNYQSPFVRCLKSMQNKQAAFLGDRSHPELVRLDAVAGTTTYPGWEEDFKEAEEAHFSGSSLGPNFDRCLHILTEKQQMRLGDRSHPRLVQLDALSLTYPGWENDVKEAEMDHVKNYQSPFVRRLKSMQNKQRTFQPPRTNVFRMRPENTEPAPSSTRQHNVAADRTRPENTEPSPSSSRHHNVAPETCIICLEKTRSHVFVPCGHYATCEACATICLQRDGNRCPTCRQRVEKAIKMYFS